MSLSSRIKRLAAALGITLAVFGLWKISGLGVAHVGMGSVKYHVVLYSQKPDRIEPRDYVLFKWRGSDHGDKGLKEGMILTKRVFCTPGEDLLTEKVRIVCGNRTKPGPKVKDSKGRPVEPWSYQGRVAKGKFFVMGDSAFSYDSRYWGFVDRQQVVGKVLLGI